MVRQWSGSTDPSVFLQIRIQQRAKTRRAPSKPPPKANISTSNQKNQPTNQRNPKQTNKDPHNKKNPTNKKLDLPFLILDLSNQTLFEFLSPYLKHFLLPNSPQSILKRKCCHHKMCVKGRAKPNDKCWGFCGIYACVLSLQIHGSRISYILMRHSTT